MLRLPVNPGVGLVLLAQKVERVSVSSSVESLENDEGRIPVPVMKGMKFWLCIRSMADQPTNKAYIR